MNTSTVDAAGNLHDAKGQFAGHVQSEADTSTVLAPQVTACPSTAGAVIDRSGFCSAHGWECGDFALARAGATREEQAGRERAASAELATAMEALTAAEKAVVKASLTGAVARLRQTFPNVKRLVLRNNGEGSWYCEVDAAVAPFEDEDVELAPDELVDLSELEFDDSTLEDQLWEWASGIDNRKTMILAPFCVGWTGEQYSLPTGMEVHRHTDEVERAEINLALFD